MKSISSSPFAPVYSSLWYELTGIQGIGPINATRFMFSANEQLNGMSPVQAIRHDRADDVRQLIGKFR